MRFWQSWWQTLILYSQQNPAKFIEFLMVLLALILVALFWVFNLSQWPYLVLSTTFLVGSAANHWVGETYGISTPRRKNRADFVLLTAILLEFFTITYLVIVSK